MSLLPKRRDTIPSLFGGFFDDFFKDDLALPYFVGNSVPAVNISEEENMFRIEVAAPGMEKDNFKLDLNNDVLTISCEKKEEEEKQEKKFTRREYSFTSFSRSFTLPQSVDAEKIQASYVNGILQISLLKKPEAQKKPVKEISIS
jgi:HSP20 family protein